MNDNVIKELHRDNLCTYFILPLLKLNKFRFLAESNFVNSFLSIDRKYIYVEVLETMFIEHKLMTHPQFCGLFSDGITYFIRYKIPAKFREELDLYAVGKYSKFSKEAKQLIYKHSGLAYKQLSDSGALVTDLRLIALEKSPILRELWEAYLKVTIHTEMDLLSIPSNKSYLSNNLTPVSVTIMSE